MKVTEDQAKLLLPTILSLIALGVSARSCNTSQKVADAALAPRVSVVGLSLLAPPVGDPDKSPLIAYHLQNIGQSRAIEVRVSTLVYLNERPNFTKVAAYAPSVDVGEPQETELTLKEKPGITFEDVWSGNQVLSITFEVTADSDWIQGHHACSEFEYDWRSHSFVKKLGCRPDTFEMMKKIGQLP